MKLMLEDDVVIDETLYSQTNMTSLFSTTLFSSFISSLIYFLDFFDVAVHIVIALSVIVQECGQTLGLGLVDKIRTVVYY